MLFYKPKILVSSFIGSLFGSVMSFSKSYANCSSILFPLDSNNTHELINLKCVKESFYYCSLGFIEGALIGTASAYTYDYLSQPRRVDFLPGAENSYHND